MFHDYCTSMYYPLNFELIKLHSINFPRYGIELNNSIWSRFIDVVFVINAPLLFSRYVIGVVMQKQNYPGRI